MRRSWFVVVLGVVAVIFAGCTTAQPSPLPTASHTQPPTSSAPITTPTPTPTFTPSPTSTRAALVISATDVTLIDASGEVVARLKFKGEDPTPFAQAISAAAGSAGIEETKPGGPEGAKFTSTFTWDSMTITTVFSPDECDAGCRGTFLYVTAPRVGTLPIHTASGIVVGQTVDEAKKRGAQPTPDLPLASDPEDPSLINSTTEGTKVVIPDADQGVIIGIRAGDWYTSLSGL
ncbi:hypothetical protein [Microbacterium laevaniformans]|uniref:hypothetical protein n=1 Tax=Microbacterium laevaniformans TaxID=36807 RepID=UPI0011D1EDE6